MNKKQPYSDPTDQQQSPRNVREDEDTRKESGDKPCSGDKPHC